MTFNEKFVKYTVPQLKKYLQERGVTVSGYRRPLLVELANAVDRVQLPVDPDFQNVACAFDSINNKLNELGIDNPWSMHGFTQDLSDIPDFGLYGIFNYLLCSTVPFVFVTWVLSTNCRRSYTAARYVRN